jgi:hypothetical protein
MRFIMLLALIGCGRTIKTGTVERTNENLSPVQNSSQYSQCLPPRNQEIAYRGIPCRLLGPIGVNFQYGCANNMTLLVNCQGQII